MVKRLLYFGEHVETQVAVLFAAFATALFECRDTGGDDVRHQFDISDEIDGFALRMRSSRECCRHNGHGGCETNNCAHNRLPCMFGLICRFIQIVTTT